MGYIIFIIIDLLLITSLLSYELVKHKGFHDKKSVVRSLVPVLGLFQGLEMTPENPKFDVSQVLSTKRVIIDGLIVSLTLFVLWMDGIAFYTGLAKLFGLSFFGLPHSIAFSFIYWFFIIVTLFVFQSITYEIMQIKGYRAWDSSLIALIPIFGVWVAMNKTSIKVGILKSSIRKAFTPHEIVAKFFVYAELLFVSILVVVPIIYIFGSSFSKVNELPATIWPKQVSFDNYIYLFKDTFFKTWYWNTFQIAIVNMVVGVIFITGAAYVFSRFKFKGKRIGLITILILQVFPSFMGLIAMFVLFETFGLLNQPLALSILYIGGAIPFNIWIIKGYLQNIPKELDESAMIDGANKIQIFFKIILPLSVPILSFVAVSMFMGPWMDYMLPNYLLNVPQYGVDPKSRWTIAVGLFDMIKGQGDNLYTTFAAGSLVVAAPITVLYLVFQKYLVEGITAGSTKG